MYYKLKCSQLKNPALRCFVESNVKASTPVQTIRGLGKEANHEIWRECPICGNVWDARAEGQKCYTCNVEGV